MKNYIEFDENKIEEDIRTGKLIPFEKLMGEVYSSPERYSEYLKNAKEIDEENQRLLLAEKLRNARKKSKITQEELARRLKTKKSYISLIESGKQNVSMDYVVKIAKALNKKVEVNIV